MCVLVHTVNARVFGSIDDMWNLTAGNCLDTGLENSTMMEVSFFDMPAVAGTCTVCFSVSARSMKLHMVRQVDTTVQNAMT